MIEERKRRDGARRRVRPMLASAAVVLGAATALAACGGSSSDDAANGSATSKAADTTAAAAAPAATQPATTQPADSAPTGPQTKAQAWTAAGTMRLAAMWIGTPGKLSVNPKGNVDTAPANRANSDHWYPKDTVVTVKAKDTKTARFMEWSGACNNKDRVCTVKMTEFKRLIGGYRLDKKAAKGLPKDDPALKVGTGA